MLVLVLVHVESTLLAETVFPLLKSANQPTHKPKMVHPIERRHGEGEIVNYYRARAVLIKSTNQKAAGAQYRLMCSNQPGSPQA